MKHDLEAVRESLSALRTHCLETKDWAGTKAVNKILLELDFFERRTCLSGFPVNLQIEHTNYCNAKCIMCSHSFTKNHGCAHMREADLSVLEEILPHVERVTLHGMGEPFLNPDILRILQKYDSCGIKMTCNTNASVMNDALAEMIHKCFYDIAVSCDGCTAETYESIRAGLTFETFKENVRLLRSKGERLLMRLAAVAMRQNLRELPGIVSLAAQLGFQEVVFTDVTTQGLLENANDRLPLYPEASKYYLALAMEEGARLGIPVKVPDYIMAMPEGGSKEDDLTAMQAFPMYKEATFSENLYRQYEASGFMETTVRATEENFALPSGYTCRGICDFVLERPFIDVKGNVFLCCTNWMHSVGNIYEPGGFATVWNGAVTQKIRALFYSGVLPKYCAGCIFLRGDMMLKKLRLDDLTEDFYHHNYDEQINELIRKKTHAGQS